MIAKALVFAAAGQVSEQEGGVIMSATQRVARASLPTVTAPSRCQYNAPEQKEHVALTLGVIDDGRPVWSACTRNA